MFPSQTGSLANEHSYSARTNRFPFRQSQHLQRWTTLPAVIWCISQFSLGPFHPTIPFISPFLSLSLFTFSTVKESHVVFCTYHIRIKRSKSSGVVLYSDVFYVFFHTSSVRRPQVETSCMDLSGAWWKNMQKDENENHCLFMLWAGRLTWRVHRGRSVQQRCQRRNRLRCNACALRCTVNKHCVLKMRKLPIANTQIRECRFDDGPAENIAIAFGVRCALTAKDACNKRKSVTIKRELFKCGEVGYIRLRPRLHANRKSHNW